MRETTSLFLVDGQPILVPDQDVRASFEDIDSASAGRDESGVMHRIPVRKKVGSWTFTYSTLTRQELDKLLCIGSEQFSYFLYPDEGKAHYLCERTRSEKF